MRWKDNSNDSQKNEKNKKSCILIAEGLKKTKEEKKPKIKYLEETLCQNQIAEK